MPRRKEPPRLWLRPERWLNGKLFSRSAWFILDGGRQIATECLARQIAEAEKKLSEYITAKHQPSRKARDIEEIIVADVLSVYFDDCREQQANKEKFDERAERNNEY